MSINKKYIPLKYIFMIQYYYIISNHILDYYILYVSFSSYIIYII